MIARKPTSAAEFLAIRAALGWDREECARR